MARYFRTSKNRRGVGAVAKNVLRGLRVLSQARARSRATGGAARSAMIDPSYPDTYKSVGLEGRRFGIPHVGLFKNPFPTRMNRILSYSGIHTMTVGSTGVLGSIQQYACNGLYDSDISGSGHQSYGFDQMMTLYDRYKVNFVKISLLVSDPTIDSLSLAYLFTNPSETTSIAGLSPYQVQEKSLGGTVTVNNSGSQKMNKVFAFRMYKLANLSKLQFKADPDNYTGSASGNPGSIPKFQFAVADLRGGSTGTVMVEIRLDYFTTFYDRKVLATS